MYFFSGHLSRLGVVRRRGIPSSLWDTYRLGVVWRRETSSILWGMGYPVHVGRC